MEACNLKRPPENVNSRNQLHIFIKYVAQTKANVTADAVTGEMWQACYKGYFFLLKLIEPVCKIIA